MENAFVSFANREIAELRKLGMKLDACSLQDKITDILGVINPSPYAFEVVRDISSILMNAVAGIPFTPIEDIEEDWILVRPREWRHIRANELMRFKVKGEYQYFFREAIRFEDVESGKTFFGYVASVSSVRQVHRFPFSLHTFVVKVRFDGDDVSRYSIVDNAAVEAALSYYGENSSENDE